MEEAKRKAWTAQDSISLYNIDCWGSGYFAVNDQGFLTVHPNQDKNTPIKLYDVIEAAREKNLHTPLLIRFQDILRHRVQEINEVFRRSISEFKYQGSYYGVFPIKVNQLREVVEEIINAGIPYHFGLEVGSKPELFAAMAIHTDFEALIVCNGYKDSSFIRMALIGLRLHKKVILVVEKLEELRQIIEISRQVGVAPMIGIRVRLQAKGTGKWAESGGENAKFGLSTSDLLEACELLQKEGMQDCFKLVHYHIGSQIPDILTVKRATQEAARYYAKIVKLGFAPSYIDVGGGLGVDYDGSKTSFDSSTNYTLQEYANDIVFNIQEVCDQEKVPHPHIVSESGRAIVAHHSVLVIDVLGVIKKTRSVPDAFSNGKEHALIKEMLELKVNLDKTNKLEAFHDALQRKEDAQNMFNLGILELSDKARIENLYWEICQELYRKSKEERYIPEEIAKLESQLSNQYVCNFSVFQSLLDHWALKQLFPIAPLSRLNEPPTQQATLADITCDSDGKIDKFTDLRDVRDSLPFHDPNGSPYYIGIFLTGAYQDIMGDFHNLLGKVNEVHIFLDPDEPEGYYIEDTISGTMISEVLSMVQYETHDLVRQIKAQVDAAIKEDRVKPSEGMKLLDEYEKGLKEYTYPTKINWESKK